MSQQVLADELGLTFQQVQKYERGSNRISASKLFEICDALQVDIGYVFEGLRDPGAPKTVAHATAWSMVAEALIAEPNGAALAEAFLSIRRRSVRKGMVDLMKAIAEGEAIDSGEPGLAAAE